jgi:hypothetical protein
MPGEVRMRGERGGEETMTEEKILTRHPRGKSGKNISRKRYETLKVAILAALRTKELTHTELSKAVAARLKGKFEGNVNWYAETVKLDLEARRVIERTPTKPQRYHIA